jgi:hypothetical protein
MKASKPLFRYTLHLVDALTVILPIPHRIKIKRVTFLRPQGDMDKQRQQPHLSLNHEYNDGTPSSHSPMILQRMVVLTLSDFKLSLLIYDELFFVMPDWNDDMIGE